jgi:hypothetical protein
VYGVYGESTGNQGRAVTGEAAGTASIGVYGIATSTSSTGVWGEGANQGVYGTSAAATGKGVYGHVNSGTGFSGYFEGGKFHVNGNVGINTESPTQPLDVNGVARIRGMTTGVVSTTVYRTSDGTLITGASDIRLKENIQPLENSLGKVMQLRGVSFSWKADSSKKHSIGFIAQEFEQVIPELVFTNENDGYKGINYAEVSAVLVEAVKELKAENDRLKAEMARMQDSFESRLARLENQLKN